MLALLGNRLYRGEIVHKGKAYAAEHPAIIDADLFDAVQARIATQRVERREGVNVRMPSLLVGIVEDGHGRRMSPSHAVKKGKRYRYYITHRAQVASDGPEAWRVPAHDLEWAVIERLRDWLGDGKAMRTVLLDTTNDVQQIAAGLKRAAVHGASFATQHARTTLVQALVQRVTLAQDSILIAIDRSALLLRLGLEVDETTRDEPIHITAPALKVRSGKETKLLLAAEDGSGAHNTTLASLLCDAALLRDQMLADPKLSIASLARSTGRCRKRLTRMLRLAWLAPDIAEAILDGRQPPALSAETLLATDLPLDWQQQRTALGFA